MARISNGILTMSNFERAVSADTYGELIVDLRGAQWADPYGVVALMCAVYDARAKSHDVRFIPPDNRDLANWLSRMRLGRCLEALGIAHGLPVVGEQDLPERIVELTTVREYDDSTRLGELLFRRLEESGPTLGVAGHLYEAVTELCNNAVEHAGVPSAYLAAHVYRRGTRNQYVQFAVGDAGIGIRTSLERAAYSSSSDSEAIRLALESDISSSREPGRGHGLPDTCGLILEVAGNVVVRSGEAKVHRGGNGRSGERVQRSAGTIVAAHIPCGVPQRQETR